MALSHRRIHSKNIGKFIKYLAFASTSTHTRASALLSSPRTHLLSCPLTRMQRSRTRGRAHAAGRASKRPTLQEITPISCSTTSGSLRLRPYARKPPHTNLAAERSPTAWTTDAHLPQSGNVSSLGKLYGGSLIIGEHGSDPALRPFRAHSLHDNRYLWLNWN